jgi:hypothetical protein
VYGIVVTYLGDLGTNKEGRPVSLQVFWKRTGQNKFTRFQRYIHYWFPGDDMETIWIHDRIDRLAITLDDSPNTFNLLNVVLLVPPKAER